VRELAVNQPAKDTLSEPPKVRILFSDFFVVSPEVLESYGALNSSLVSDLPLFIDPFLLFNNPRDEYQRLHAEIIRYLSFLRDKSVSGSVDEGLLKAWYFFGEVKETWLGFTKSGNRGSGLGPSFARALNENFGKLFSTNGQQITKSHHLEKLCLIRDRVGRDNISDFTTNLIKGFLLEYTAAFAKDNVCDDLCKDFGVSRVRFNYETESWDSQVFRLPLLGSDFVLLVPKDLLTRDDTWINREDLIKDFRRLPGAIPDAALRSQIHNYFRKALPKKPKEKDRKEAALKTISAYPELIDFYIKYKEDNGGKARSLSGEKVAHAEQLFLQNFKALAELLSTTNFYKISGTSYEEAHARIRYLKQVIEHNDGYRLFYVDRKPVQREEDLQVAFKFTWFGTLFDVNREVNNGRGPADYKISYGSSDSTIVEFKLASNSQLKQNLKNQTAVYEEANQTRQSIKVVLYFTAAELAKVARVLKQLGLDTSPDIVLIDARRDNKESASKVK
jgi:hypothetical protein